jgi:CrcB protein
MLRNLLLAGVGGFIGSAARYGMGAWVTHLSAASRFPFGTLAVNAIGCLLIGLLAGVAEREHIMSASTRLFLLTGVLGGFTTYSAFAYETVFLARTAHFAAALANVALQLVLGLALVWIGHAIASRLAA